MVANQFHEQLTISKVSPRYSKLNLDVGQSFSVSGLCFSAYKVIINFCVYSDNTDSNSILENSLNAKEKIISELNMELHNIETTLSNEREEHINEIKKLNTLLHEKV